MTWKVVLIESERGWGQRVDDIIEFGSYEEAKQFQTEFNSRNNKDTVPDWYMYAQEPKKGE